ncbi:MAG: 30S ribosomal protein S14 [Candidatus Diapherotrites archaeon CG08_land_8_20_14_0_20_30_16]|nr:MAG: 30S ribosomal protein S14 [Candidatus Diapherotrites archaeon CG08_land_8_20_14_0_20_30_16]
MNGDFVKDDKKQVCKFCGNGRAVIRKYGLYLCKLCFKDRARELGFEKLE